MGHKTIGEAFVGAECQSLLEQDCANDTGEACEQCAEAHGLHLHGCSKSQIGSFCNSAGSASCDKEFNKVCPASARKDENSCLECARTHRRDLEEAKCTPAHIEHVCSGAGPSPGPGPSPTPPGPGPSPGSDLLTKILLDNSDPSAVGGRCLDGSPAGYHYGEAKLDAANKWVIFVKGGGACGTEKTCTEFSKSLKGSSKHWGPTINGDNVYSGDPNVNPDFYTWNRVRVAYCTGDCHSGQRTGPSADTWNFWFDGHLNFKRIITDLKEKHGLDNATHVLMSGNSAGGLGTFINVDYLASQLPSAKVFKAAPQAGWFFPGDPAATPKGAGLPRNFTAKEITHSSSSVDHSVTGSLYQGYVNPACLAAYPKAEQQFCGSVHNLYRYIATPLLVIENQYDTNQIYSSAGGAPKHPEGKEIQVCQKIHRVSYHIA